MIYVDLINATGTYDLNAGDTTKASEGTVYIGNPNGSHTYTVGTKSRDDSFVGLPDGLITGTAHVLHGKGARLQLQVGGAVTPGDDLDVGYAG